MAIAALAISASPGRAQDFFADRVELRGNPPSNMGDFSQAGPEAGDPALPASTRGRSLWWTWVAPSHGEARVDLFGISEGFGPILDTVLGIFTGDSLETLVRVTWDDDSGGDVSSRCTFVVTPGTAYHILADLHAGEELLGTGFVSLHFEDSAGDPPENDAFSNAIRLEGDGATGESTFARATREDGEPTPPWPTRGRSLWWEWTCPFDGVATISLEAVDADLDTVLSVHTGTGLGDLQGVAFNDDHGETRESQAMFLASGGTRYFIQADLHADSNSGGGVRVVATLRALPPPELRPANDDFEAATVLTGNRGTAEVNNEHATGQSLEPIGNGGLLGRSVWWQWTAPATGFLRIHTRGSRASSGGPMDTVLVLYQGAALGALEELEWNDDHDGLLTSELTSFVESGATYFLAVTPLEDSPAGTVHLAYEIVDPPRAPLWSARSLEDADIWSVRFAGQVQIVNLWATWCGPCLQEIPDLIELYEAYKDQGLVVIGVSVDDPQEDQWPFDLVSRFVEDLQITYPVVLDRPSGSVERGFGDANAIPTTYVINRDGGIVRKVVGTRTRGEFEQMILPWIAPTGPPPVAKARLLDGGQIEISWEHQPGLTLKESTHWGDTWEPVATLPATDGTRRIVTVPTGDRAAFFRLTRQ